MNVNKWSRYNTFSRSLSSLDPICESESSDEEDDGECYCEDQCYCHEPPARVHKTSICSTSGVYNGSYMHTSDEIYLDAGKLQARQRSQRKDEKTGDNSRDTDRSDAQSSTDKGVSGFFRRKFRSMCSRKQLVKRVPILEWLPKYNAESAVSDIIAGFTVGLTVIPQGIAYAIIAQLPPQYGLYSAFMGCFGYCIFGSSKDITIGPTAIMALMTGEYAALGPEYAVLLAFLSGCIILLFGILQLGFVIEFISVPVIAGFTSAAAITIASGQVKSLLGLTIGEKSHLHWGIIPKWIDVGTYIKTIRWQDTTLGVICCIILLSLRALNRTSWFKPSDTVEQPSRIQSFFNRLPPTSFKILAKVVWFICTGRNAIIVCSCALMAYGLDPEGPEIVANKTGEYSTFMLTGKIDGGLPTFQLPSFGLSANETTTGEAVTFGKMLGELGSAIIIIPLIGILESVAIAKAFAGGKHVDASQEMIALGACNLMGSFVQSMPTTGSFSRTAINSATGVKTPLGGIYTGGLVILCLALLMPYCAFIPKASLAAVIITAVIFSVEHHVIKPMWKSKKIDLIPGFVCFFGCLFYELAMGILFGVAVQILIVLWGMSRPKLNVEVQQVMGTRQQFLRITPNQGVIFPSASYVRALINKAGVKQGQSVLPVVIDCSHIYQTDFTAGKGFKAMLEDFTKRSQPVYWLRPQPHVQHTLQALAGTQFVTIANVDQLVNSEDPEDPHTPSADRHTGPLIDETPAHISNGSNGTPIHSNGNNGTPIHSNGSNGTPSYGGTPIMGASPTRADVEEGSNAHL